MPETELKPSLRGWIVCMSAALFFFYIFIQMLLFNVVGHPLMAEFSLTSTDLGMLSSVYFWGNVVFLLPAGLLLDRFSIKKILIISLTIMLLAILLFSFATSLDIVIIARFLIGATSAFALLTGLRLASHWFPPANMALVTGMITTMGFLGGLVAQTPLTILVGAVGWRHAMQWDVVLGLFFIFIMLLAVKDCPDGHTQAIADENKTSIAFLFYSIRKALGNPQNWLYGLYTSLLNLPVFIIGAAFGIRYLEQAHNLYKIQASYVTSMVLIGSMIGSPILGWASDKMKARKPLMIIAALLSIVVILAIMYIPNMDLTWLLILFLLLGFFTSAQVISYPAIAESNRPDIIGAGLSIGSILIMLGGVIPLPLFGWLLDMNWNGQTVAGIPFHSIADYQLALWIIPAAFVIGLIAVLIAKETNCKNITVK